MGRLYLVLSVVLGVLILFLVQERNELLKEEEVLHAKVQSLDESLRQAERRIGDLSLEVEGLKASPIPVSTPTIVTEERPQASVIPKKNSSFEVSARIAGVSSLIPLSENERSEIAAAASAEEGFSDDILRRVLGEDRFENYSKKRAEFDETMRQEVSESETFSLSRKLELTREQEGEVGALVTLSRDKFMPRRGTPEWSALPVEERPRTIALLRLEIARQKFLADNLRSVLSEEQYNKLLEIQSSSSAAQSHSGFLDEAATDEAQAITPR